MILRWLVCSALVALATSAKSDTVVVVDSCTAMGACAKPEGDAVLVLGEKTLDGHRRRRVERGSARLNLADDPVPARPED